MANRRGISICNKTGDIRTGFTVDFRVMYPSGATPEEIMEEAYNGYRDLLNKIREETGVWVV